LETQDPSLKIYKSSAGSGKTYQLVLNYLSLILKSTHPDKFKKILAITFTNKASQEMKERVLDGLRKLKEGKDDRFIRDYHLHTGLPPHELAEKADTLLTNILHSYGHLNILTIDKFVHRIIRSFSRELGLSTNFELAFDFDDIATRCIDEVLQELGTNDHLTKVLIEYYKQLIDQEENPNIEKALVDRANILKQEGAREKLAFYNDKDLSFFMEVRTRIKKEAKDLRAKALQHKSQIEALLGGHANNLKNGSTKAFSSILKGWENNGLPTLFTDSQLIKIQNGEWLSTNGKKQNPELASLTEAHGADLQDWFLSIHHTVKELIFLKSLDRNLMSFAMLNDIQQQIERYKQDNNIVLIGELNHIISSIISEESAPYIYEKIGARFENYFVDEFQDTSTLQWQNLVPLIHDSLSSGNENLIVGDAKQSIYRWRGGNVHQFIDLPTVNIDIPDRADINQSFQYNHQGYILKENYRSSRAVVDFNNWFFPSLTEDIESPLIQSIYAETAQEVKKKDDGYVEISIIKKEAEYDKDIPYGEKLLNQINQCIEDGYVYKDICILVRTNNNGSEIAQFLISKDLPVTSQDSLLLGESDHIKLIHALLKALNKATEENIVRLFSYFKKKSLIYLFEKYRIPSENNSFYNAGYDFKAFVKNELTNFDSGLYAQLSIFDQVNYLIKILDLAHQDEYLDKLLNAAFDFQQRFGHQTNRFIEHLEDKIMNSSVVPSSSANAITIMTIHKSKGLQFPVVIIPKKIDSDNKDAIWLTGEKVANLGLSTVNMQVKKDILDDQNKAVKDAQDELALADLLNLVYVAYTRAQQRMYITYFEHKAPNLVKKQMKLIENHPDYATEEAMIKLGSRTPHQTNEGEVRDSLYIISNTETSDWRNRLILASPAEREDFAEASISERNRGLALHEILQDIDSPSDFEGALTKFIKKHKEWEPFSQQLRETLTLFAQKEEVQSIYKDVLNSYSERSLGTSFGAMLRPDKVLEKEHEVVVIDFKTGQQKTKHVQQILEYGHLLQGLYQKPIKMYLIYLSSQNVTITHV
jgi:ATP-dependent exoDNAse (exonuclease V) beta subunit